MLEMIEQSVCHTCTKVGILGSYEATSKNKGL